MLKANIVQVALNKPSPVKEILLDKADFKFARKMEKILLRARFIFT
ncbi:MAG: hypothetical protein ACUVQY_01450 [Thermoproteota archaeon]